VRLEEVFRVSVKTLRDSGHDFAVCGGVAAMIYRTEIRYTGDVDFLLDAGSQGIEIAEKLVESLGLKAQRLRSAQLCLRPGINKKHSPIEVIAGRRENDKTAVGVDVLFPIQSWTTNALRRAKYNIIKLHDIEAPFLTPEDMLLAKFSAYSLSGGRRTKDWDDIKSILNSDRRFDIGYLTAELSRLKLTIVSSLEKQLPKELALTFKRTRLERKHGK
jgi:hypothetical protein